MSAESVDEVIVAVDVNAAAVTVGVVTMRGEVIDRDVAQVDQRMQAETLFSEVLRLIDGQMERARDHHLARAVAVGVGCEGPVTTDVEAVSPAHLPVWRDFPLRSRLAAATSLPVFGDLDAKALALAEGWLGAAQGKDCFMAMVVGSSVAGGIVLNGQLLDGASGAAGLAPMMAMWSCPGRGPSGWALARRQAFSRRARKRSACSGVSREMACARAPGVPKSLVWLPRASTRVS